MCDTLQLNWKLPNQNQKVNNKNHPHTKMTSNNNNSNSQKQKKEPKQKAKQSSKKANSQKGEYDPVTGKYTLRAASVQKRIEVEHRKTQPKKRGPKPRPRPLPMSKYRRKTANLRERQRMGEINNAFDRLKEKIPTPIMLMAEDDEDEQSSGSPPGSPLRETSTPNGGSNGNSKARCEKMTKINVLHVAINYIRALENILETGDAGVNVYGTAVVQSPLVALPLASQMIPFEGEDDNNNAGSSVHTQRVKAIVQKSAKKRKTLADLKAANSTKKEPKPKKESKKSKKLNKANSLSSNTSLNSDDSGMVDCDFEAVDEGGDDKAVFGLRGFSSVENTLKAAATKSECPDWTELTSTLDLFQNQQHQNGGQEISNVQQPSPQTFHIVQPNQLIQTPQQQLIRQQQQPLLHNKILPKLQICTPATVAGSQQPSLQQQQQPLFHGSSTQSLSASAVESLLLSASEKDLLMQQIDFSPDTRKILQPKFFKANNEMASTTTVMATAAAVTLDVASADMDLFGSIVSDLGAPPGGISSSGLDETFADFIHDDPFQMILS